MVEAVEVLDGETVGSTDMLRRLRWWIRRAIYAIPMPPDEPREWHGLDVPGRPLRIVRFGDCSWRETDLGHQTGTRPGYPLVLAELLAERGVAMQFTDVYVASVAELPSDAEGLTRHLHLDGPPDVVILQPALGHATRVLLPVNAEINRLRRLVAHWVGRAAGPLYAMLHPIARRFGRYASPYPGPGGIDPFLSAVRSTWPNAHAVALGPPARPRRNGWADPEQLERVWAQVAEHARAFDVDTLDVRDGVEATAQRLGDAAVFGANACDLRRPGHEAVGHEVLAWLAQERLV